MSEIPLSELQHCIEGGITKLEMALQGDISRGPSKGLGGIVQDSGRRVEQSVVQALLDSGELKLRPAGILVDQTVKKFGLTRLNQ